MLLTEIYDNEHDAKVIRIIADGATGSGHSSADKVNIAVNYAMRRWPSLVYKGPMYRVMYISASEFANLSNNSQVMQKIASYDDPTDMHQNREYFSYSKTLEGIGEFTTHQMSDSWEGGVGVSNVRVGVVVHQISVGLDLAKMRTMFKSEPESHSLHNPAYVQEVLARAEQGAKVATYLVGGLGGSLNGTEYGYEQYKDDVIADGEEDDMMSRAEFEEENGTHFPQQYQYRPDQFTQLITAIKTFMSGKSRIAPRKRPHPRSAQARVIPGGSGAADDIKLTASQKKNPYVDAYRKPADSVDRDADARQAEWEQRMLARKQGNKQPRS